MNKKLIISILVGNVLDHYDTALFIYLASIISKVFFNFDDPLVGLIYVYSLLPMRVIARPLGAIYFANLSNKKGAIKSLQYSLIGTSIVTFFISIIPGYKEIGLVSSVLLISFRFFQSFFGAGEHNIALMFLMKNFDEKHRSVASGLFNISTFLGMSGASMAAYLVTISSNPLTYWRIAYFLGILTSIVGLIFRYHFKELYNQNDKNNNDKIQSVQVEGNDQPDYKNVFIIAIIYVFSMMNYHVPCVFFNDFIPLINNNITKAQMLYNNSFIMNYNILLIIPFAFLAKKIQHRSIMIFCVSTILLITLPAFIICQYSSIFVVEVIRVILVTVGALFSITSQVYIYNISKRKNLYKTHSYGVIIGQDFISRFTITICLSLWYFFNSVVITSAYIITISGILLIVLQRQKNC